MAVVTVAILLYLPGLSGDFLFDDYANLPALGRYGPVRDWDALARYLTSGIADPTGRPVSMLSFLLDADTWPADPFPLKRTNVILHAANGLLLYRVLAALGAATAIPSSQATAAAALAASAWLLHPLWASTVLYVVQRHAMLAAFFVLLGVRAWLASRHAFEEGRVLKAWGLAIVAVPVCGLLAGLSKANGFLLPLLLLALHVSVLRTDGMPADAHRGRRAAARASLLLLWLPAAALVAGLGWMGLDAVASTGETRPWTLGQRLLTQPRALLDYVYRILVPSLDATGVFADGFAVSSNWRQPWTTLPAALALLGMGAAAWFWRMRAPAFSAAVLFFLAGHAMESTVIPLELYFEHRNYLPAMLLFWPFALLLVAPGPYLRLRFAGAVGFLLVCAALTLAQSRLWGDPDALARAWARALPDSPRAQTYAASRDLEQGRPEQAIARLTPLLAMRPGEAQYALTLLEAHCLREQVPAPLLSGLKNAMEPLGVKLDVTHQWLARTLAPDRAGACSALPDDVLGSLLAAAVPSPMESSDPETQSRVERLEALVALRSSACDKALAHYNRRLMLQRRPEAAHEQIGLLATYCGPRDALAHLDFYLSRAEQGDTPMHTPVLRLRDRIMARQGFWDAEWRRLRGVLQNELHSPQRAHPLPSAHAP